MTTKHRPSVEVPTRLESLVLVWMGIPAAIPRAWPLLGGGLVTVFAAPALGARTLAAEIAVFIFAVPAVMVAVSVALAVYMAWFVLIVEPLRNRFNNDHDERAS